MNVPRWIEAETRATSAKLLAEARSDIEQQRDSGSMTKADAEWFLAYLDRLEAKWKATEAEA